jgi:hypothetical protein
LETTPHSTDRCSEPRSLRHVPDGAWRARESGKCRSRRLASNVPILIDPNGRVIAGHGRLLALRRTRLERGADLVPRAPDSARSANTHTGQRRSSPHRRPDRWQHPTASDYAQQRSGSFLLPGRGRPQMESVRSNTRGFVAILRKAHSVSQAKRTRSGPESTASSQTRLFSCCSALG